MAVTGHTDIASVETYISEAKQATMADAAFERLYVANLPKRLRIEATTIEGEPEAKAA